MVRNWRVCVVNWRATHTHNVTLCRLTNLVSPLARIARHRGAVLPVGPHQLVELVPCGCCLCDKRRRSDSGAYQGKPVADRALVPLLATPCNLTRRSLAAQVQASEFGGPSWRLGYRDFDVVSSAAAVSPCLCASEHARVSRRLTTCTIRGAVCGGVLAAGVVFRSRV